MFSITNAEPARMLVEIRAQSAHLTGCQGLHADDVMYHVIDGLAHKHH